MQFKFLLFSLLFFSYSAVFATNDSGDNELIKEAKKYVSVRIDSVVNFYDKALRDLENGMKPVSVEEKYKDRVNPVRERINRKIDQLAQLEKKGEIKKKDMVEVLELFSSGKMTIRYRKLKVQGVNFK